MRLLAIVVILTTACGTPPPPDTGQLTVAASAPSVAPGRQVFFTATGSAGYATGTTWTSSDPSVLTIVGRGDGTATATGVAPGEVTIAATAAGGSGAVAFEVADRRVVGVAVTAGASVPAGLDLAATAVAMFDDGTTRDVTGQAAWTSSADGVATVRAGWVTGAVPGSARISASFGGQSGAATIAVIPGLQSIAVSGSASVIAGRAIYLTAMAAFADGSSRDVSMRAAWTLDDPGHATIRPGGLVTGLAPASFHASAAIGGSTGALSVTVAPAVMTGLRIDPFAPLPVAGSTLQMTAVATLSDGTERDVSAQATWSSSDPTTATVSPAGLVTTLAKGFVDIHADLGAYTSQGYVLIPPGHPTALEVRLLFPGQHPRQELQALATFPDGSTWDLTHYAVWATSDPTVLEVSNVYELRGLVMSIGTTAASATISATLDGVTGQTQVQVRP